MGEGQIVAALGSGVEAHYPLANFVSREPGLEDIFLRYYQTDGSPSQKDTGSVVS